MATRLLAVALLGVTRLLAVALGLALVVTTAALLVALGGVRLLSVAGVATVIAVVAVLLRVARLLAHGCFSCVACSAGVPAGSIGVDDRAGAELSRVQRLGALQEDYDLTEGVQPLVGEMPGDVVRQVVHDPGHVVAGDAIEIVWTEHHGEPVRRQLAPSRELLDLVFGFPLQRAFDLLGNDATSEDPRGSVAHHPLETALEPPDAAHRSSSDRIGVLLTPPIVSVLPTTVGPDRVPRCVGGDEDRASFSIARASGGMADAHGSGPCVRKDVRVQLPPRPPCHLRIAGRSGWSANTTRFAFSSGVFSAA